MAACAYGIAGVNVSDRHKLNLLQLVVISAANTTVLEQARKNKPRRIDLKVHVLSRRISVAYNETLLLLRVNILATPFLAGPHSSP